MKRLVFRGFLCTFVFASLAFSQEKNLQNFSLENAKNSQISQENSHILSTQISQDSQLFAQNQNSQINSQTPQTPRKSPLDEKSQRIYESIAGSDEMGDYTQNVLDPFVATGSLALSASEYASEYFVGEVFAIKLHAKSTEKTDFEFALDFVKNDSLIFLNPSVKFTQNEDDYSAVLYFQALDANAELAQIIVSLKRNKIVFQQAQLNIAPLSFKRINGGKNYSHIVASELGIRHFRSDLFDDKNLVINIELNAKNANLQGFHLNNEKIIEQRVDGLRGDFAESSGFYSAVLPPNTSDFYFEYFDLNAQKMLSYTLKIELSTDKISTQSDLNPKNSSLDFYKRLGLWVFAGIFGLIFAFRRRYAYLIIALVIFGVSFLIGSSNTAKIGILKENSKAQLLPTTQSSYFQANESEAEVEILGQRQDYVKILLKDGRIGWVKKDSLK